jgi:heat shock protein HslJ
MRATLVVGGDAWPECEMQRAGGAPTPTVQARGNEPFWSVEISHTLRFRTPTASFEGPAPEARLQDGVRRYDGTLDGRPISIALREQRCSDTMTGMPHPLSAEVQFDGRRYRGCGGNPVDLLVGTEWVVEDIGGGMVDRSRATLNFAADGHLHGRASCNTYTTTFRLSGEGLTVGKTAATMMACAPSLMQQEGRFLDILQKAQRFEIMDSGALVLVTADGRRITARRPK